MKLRKTGIEAVGDVPWGTHFCQFYQTDRDLLDVLVPYFKEGLDNNEFCMWVTSEPLSVSAAKEALSRAVGNFDNFLKKGQIEIINYTDWYVQGGKFDSDRVLAGWVEKEKTARTKGFDGLRLTGNTFWLEKKDWKDFTDYEEEVNRVIGDHQMIALCTYSLDRCSASEVMDVMSNHEFALIRRKKRWDIIGNAEHKSMVEALKEAAWRFRVMADFTYDWEYWHGSRGNMIYTTPSCERITGYSADEFVYDPKLIERIVHPDDRHIMAAHLSEVKDVKKETGPVSFDFRIITKGGDVRWISHVCQKVCGVDGMYIGRRASNRDISDRKRVESELKHYSENLERMVEERTKEIDRTRAELIASAKLSSMSRLGGAIAHQLNTPLCGGKLFVETLMERLANSPKDLELLRRVNGLFDNMKNTINCMRNLMGAAMRKPSTMAPININDIISGITDLIRVECINNNIDLTCDLRPGLPRIETVMGELDQVFLNIINNAIDAMPDGGRLFIQTSSNEKGIEVLVADTGVGIGPEQRDKIFEPFFSASNGGKGLGIGLPMARQIAKKYGGEISFKSEIGIGTEFVIHLPV